MISIFRKIRKALLSENRISQYVIYALGEVLLVVIGILIALQVNNWNEEDKLETSINDHLIILKKDLKEDQKMLLVLKQAMTNNYHYADSLMMQLKTLVPIDNSTTKYLGKLLLEYRFRPHTNAIETINQSNEIPALEEDLRTAILNYYALCENAKERELISNTQIQTKYEPYINEHYPEVFQKNSEWAFIKEFYKDDPREIIELDRSSFRSDKQLEALVSSRYFQSDFLKDFYTRLLDSSEEILRLIKEYN